MNAVLSADELAHYKEHGYVLPRYRLPDPLLQQLRKSLTSCLPRTPMWRRKIWLIPTCFRLSAARI